MEHVDQGTHIYAEITGVTLKLVMAQGFKGPRKSTTITTTNSNAKHKATQMRKGARVIAPKKQAARIKAQVTSQLTATLNRRAESTLISRIGHEETSLKLIKADEHLLEEIKEKKLKKEQTRGNGCDTSKLPESSNNNLMKSAIDRLNSAEGEENDSQDDDDDDDEIFTEDEEFPVDEEEK